MSISAANLSIRRWLLLSAFLVFAMVAVGGLTRLTRSGLSIVEWKPITGILPPLNLEQWQQEFEKYKQYPEYQNINRGMELSEFKFIYAWEYGHRLLGRVIGLVFGLPLIVFAWRRQVRGSLAIKLLIALMLGGMQGVLGWFMVKSGLVSVPKVSHYRLAAHLGLALFIMSFLYWIALDLKYSGKQRQASQRFASLSSWFLGLISIQIFYGALTAGLHAGHMYNTFPLMHGQLIPQGIGSLGWFRDFLENPVTVQFVHRTLGWLVFFSALGLAWLAFRDYDLASTQRRSLYNLAAMALLQFTLGVLTLLNAVPLALASLHQIGACILLLLAVHAVHQFRTQPLKSRPESGRSTAKTISFKKAESQG